MKAGIKPDGTTTIEFYTPVKVVFNIERVNNVSVGSVIFETIESKYDNECCETGKVIDGIKIGGLDESRD